MQAFIEELTKSTGSQDDSHNNARRNLLQKHAMECLRGARHTRYVSEFLVGFQAIAYAVSGSRLVVDMLGHISPGGSYTLLKSWLGELGGSILDVPDGFIVVAFDNEQRLLRNYLSRGSNRSRLDILTNVCCAVIDGSCERQNDASLHPSSWQSAEELAAACCGPSDILEEQAFRDVLVPYLSERIAGLCHEQGSIDEVESVRKEMEITQKYVQCPACGTLIEKAKRNCTNTECSVGNIRQAIAEASGINRVSTEKKKEVREVRRAHRIHVFESVSEKDNEGIPRLSMKRKHSTVIGDRSEVPSVKKADVRLMEPCFVNPNSHEALRVLLRAIGTSAGLSQYGGNKRKWLPIECDGLPNVLVRSVVHNAQVKAFAEAKTAAGIPDVEGLPIAAIRDELAARGLRKTLSKGERVEVLRNRLRSSIEADISSGRVTVPARPPGEFDWVVLKSGGLHWEMKPVQSVIEVLWPFVYKAFVESQGYTTERQQEWAKAAKDHHRSFDELSCFIDGTFDELLRPYVASNDSPTPDGFYQWASQFSKNLSFSWLLELTTRCAFGVVVYRFGLRHNKPDLCMLGRRAVSPLLHARQHPNYQLIDVRDERDLLSFPPDLKNLLQECWTLSRLVYC